VKRSPLARSSAKPKAPKPKRCANRPACRETFVPRNSFHVACCPECAIALGAAKKAKEAAQAAKAERAAHQAKKEAAKRRSDWLRETQTLFNLMIRLRDRGQPCISCGTTADVQYAAGHYRSVGAAPNLRFCEDNVHLQCNKNCNSAKGGNAVQYRLGLIKKIGLARVEALEADQTPRKWSIPELKALKEELKAKVKTLQAGQSCT